MNLETAYAEHLPDVLDRVLQISQEFFPGTAARAKKALSLLLGNKLLPAAQKDIWASSYLAKGAPVEFTFKTDQKGIQYTVDLRDPEMPPSETLEAALARLSQLDSHPLPEEYLLFFEELQNKGSLVYGCWVGGRHSAERDEYKLYVEVPENRADMAVGWLARNTGADFRSLPLGKNQTIKPEIIGYSLGRGAIECYFSIFGLAPWELDSILKPVAMEGSREILLDLLQAVSCRAVYREFPTKEMGCSYAFLPGENHSVFSLYTFASAVLGDDKHARETLLSLARQKGWNMEYYGEFTRPFVQYYNPTYTHGLVGFSIDRGGRTAVYTGLSPEFFRHNPDGCND